MINRQGLNIILSSGWREFNVEYNQFCAKYPENQAHLFVYSHNVIKTIWERLWLVTIIDLQYGALKIIFGLLSTCIQYVSNLT